MDETPRTRIMGLDIGLKRTGISLSDETRLIASPLEVLEHPPGKKWAQKIKDLAEAHEASEIVVGLPLDHNGEVGQDGENIRKFIALLREAVSIPVIEWDERFTTAQAERVLLGGDVSRKGRKAVIDKVAASIILQGYLDSLRFQKSLEKTEWNDED